MITEKEYLEAQKIVKDYEQQLNLSAVICSWSYEELLILYAEQNLKPNEKPEWDCSEDGNIIFFQYKKGRKYEIKCCDILKWLYEKVRLNEKIFVGRWIS